MNMDFTELKTEIEKFKDGFEENMKRVNSANSEKFDAINMDFTDAGFEINFFKD